MQFNEKYICFVSKNRQIRYIFTIFFANFLFVYSVHIFCFYSQKMFHKTKKAICQMKSLFTFSSGKWLLFTVAVCQLYI